MTDAPSPTPPPAPAAHPAASAASVAASLAAAPAPEPPAAPPPEAPMARRVLRMRPGRGVQPGLVAAWLLAAVGLTVSVLLWQKVTKMQEQLARQSGEAGQQSVEARTLARQAEAAVRENSGKVAALETKVADMAAYRAQFEALAQSVALARDENLAVELETAVRVAQDQTQLTGSVEPLLAALSTAERRLARARDARLVPVTRAVANDLQAIRRASIPDTAGLLARIDQLLRQVDDLPAANDVGRGARDGGPRGASAPAAPSGAWERLWSGVLAEARALLRVSRIERPEASMMSPEQVFFVRENLKLRLHGARLGILARQYEAARADLAAASLLLGAWFDPAARRTQAAATLMQQVQASTKFADVPRAEATLRALAAATAVDAAGSGR